MASTVIALILTRISRIATLPGRVVASGRTFGACLARSLLLEVARGIQTLRAVRHLAIIGRVAVLSAALTEVRIAGLLEALKEVFVGVPAVTAGVTAFPGAQLLSLRTLARLVVASVAPAPATIIGRGVAALAA
jgi:hypothetical protein